MKSSSFLSLARRGPHGLKAYLKSAALIISIALAVALRSIHRRSLFSTFTAEQSIRWRRILQAALLYFGLWAIPFLMKWWLDPSRVMLVFNASIWWPRAWTALMLSPLVCLMMSVFLGYILQAAALLIRSPLALAGFVAVCHTLSWTVADHHPLSWQYWSAAIFLFALVVCVARDNGMEIYCGAQIAVELISNLVLRVGGERASAHTLFWAPHRSTSPLWFGFSAVLTAAFYLILFGRTGIPATWRLGRLWGRP